MVHLRLADRRARHSISSSASAGSAGAASGGVIELHAARSAAGWPRCPSGGSSTGRAWTTTSKPSPSVGERTIGVPAVGGNQARAARPMVRRVRAADLRHRRRPEHVPLRVLHLGAGRHRRPGRRGAHPRRRARRHVPRARRRDGQPRFLQERPGAPTPRAAGVHVKDALPGGLWRLSLVRFDLRQHRKVVVIDGRVGYTGSLNMADPRLFKRDAGVGQWIDAMTRIEGPAVEALGDQLSLRLVCRNERLARRAASHGRRQAAAAARRRDRAGHAHRPRAAAQRRRARAADRRVLSARGARAHHAVFRAQRSAQPRRWWPPRAAA